MPAADTSITFTVFLGKFTRQPQECCKKPVIPQSDEPDYFALFDGRANVGDCKERWFD